MLFVIFLANVDLNIFNYDNIPGKGLLLLLEKKKYTDVTFLVEGYRISAHRCIVASQSDYFDCLLFGSMKEAQSDEVTLEDTPVEAFRVLLSYMYSGVVKTLELLVSPLSDHCPSCLVHMQYTYSKTGDLLHFIRDFSPNSHGYGRISVTVIW